jgi:hypothetical protein
MNKTDNDIVEKTLQTIKGHWTEEMIDKLVFELDTLLIDKHFVGDDLTDDNECD